MRSKKNLIVVSVLVLLVLITAVQSFQLFGMKDDMSNIEATAKPAVTSSATTSSSSSSSGGALPTNLQNLPGMVGGC